MKLIDQNIDENMIKFLVSSAEKFDTIPDNFFDLYVISFGLRNVPNIPNALQEAHRILKPGGRFLCLEFSKVQNKILSEIYNLYSFNIIPLMG